MSISPAIAGVILAAGSSSRMGSDKAMLPWQGSTFLAAAIERLTPFCELVLVVGGANSQSLKHEVYSRAAFLVVNKQPELGQFSSLRVGLEEVLNRGRDTALVTLVDRPPAEPSTLAALIGQLHAETPAAAVPKWAWVPEMKDVAGQRRHGHPILIAREMIEAFLSAPATSNARDVEHAHQAHIEYVTVDDPAVVCNINTPEDYRNLIAAS